MKNNIKTKLNKIRKQLNEYEKYANSICTSNTKITNLISHNPNKQMEPMTRQVVVYLKRVKIKLNKIGDNIINDLEKLADELNKIQDKNHGNNRRNKK